MDKAAQKQLDTLRLALAASAIGILAYLLDGNLWVSDQSRELTVGLMNLVGLAATDNGNAVSVAGLVLT